MDIIVVVVVVTCKKLGITRFDDNRKVELGDDAVDLYVFVSRCCVKAIVSLNADCSVSTL